MIVIIVAMVVVALVGFFAGGRLTGSNGRTPPSPVGGNKDSDDCTALCNQWDQRRQERCNAESAARASQQKVDNLRAQLAVAGAVAAALAVAAYVASLIPIYGWIAAAVLGAAAAAAFLAADFILGKLSVADEELGNAQIIAANARNAEAEARALLVNRCPAQANECLARPSPC